MQALHQACRALRPRADTAQPEIEALALVRSTAVCSDPDTCLSSRVFGVQALMPRQALAGHGSHPLQQLHALASLHARIRRGQLEVANELSVSRDLLPADSILNQRHCTLSPAGVCAVLAADIHDSRQALLHSVGNQGAWSCRQPALTGRCCHGFSPCGTVCAFVYESAGEDLAVSVFHVRERRWSQQVFFKPRVDVGVFCDTIISFSSTGPLLGATLTIDGSHLLLFGVAEAFAVAIPAAHASACLCVAGLQQLVLLTHRSVAQLPLAPLPSNSVDAELAELAATA